MSLGLQPLDMPRSRTLVVLALALVTGALLLSRRGQVVYQEGSGGERIRVVERADGVRVLYLGSSRGRQTALDPARPRNLELPYTRVAMTTLALVPADARILFVGLGGGAMPRYAHELLPDARIQVVEIDPRVVDVAREWFGFREDSLLRVRVDDGRATVEAARTDSWDLVVLDAFSGGEIPLPLATREFLQAVRRALAPRGIVVGNLHTTLREYRSMLATYQQVFGRVVLLDVPRRRQRIVVAADTAVLERDSWLARLDAFSQRRDPGFDARGLVAWGFASPDPVRSPVLTDSGIR